MENKYCNLVGTNKIKDEYTKINTGFDRVETDIDALNDLIDTLKNSGVDIYNNIVEAREDIAEINELLGDDELETEAQTITGAINELKRGKRVARFTIGTTQNGWTAEKVDYLCDGVDDQDEIIQALKNLPETGGEIVILDGTYNITASINILKDNVSIRGNGNATTLKRGYNSTDTDSGPTARGLITLNGKSGCKIQDLQIDGNETGLQIDGNETEHTVSYNCGIYLYSSNNNTITGNTCNNNSTGGIYLSSSSYNTVTGNTCTYNNYDGIYLSASSKNNTITGNTCTNNSTGIELYSSSETTITGNTCSNNIHSGILLYSSSNNTITGNTYTYNNYGIYLFTSSSNNTVTGNICNNNSNSGILLAASSNNTVTGNTCIRGTGTPNEDYTTEYTILLSGADNNYNLISFNNCMGKKVEVEGGRGNSVWGNKFDGTSDLPWAEITNDFPVFGEGNEPDLAEGDKE